MLERVSLRGRIKARATVLPRHGHPQTRTHKSSFLLPGFKLREPGKLPKPQFLPLLSPRVQVFAGSFQNSLFKANQEVPVIRDSASLNALTLTQH